MSPRERRAPRPRRERSATESLLSIVLVLEALLVFFLTLVVFGLDQLPPVPAFVGGGVLLLVIIALSGAMRHPSAVWIAWLVQVALILAGFLVPIMFAIGIGFAGLFTYCFVTGRRLDRKNSALRDDPGAAQPEGESS